MFNQLSSHSCKLNTYLDSCIRSSLATMAIPVVAVLQHHTYLRVQRSSRQPRLAEPLCENLILIFTQECLGHMHFQGVIKLEMLKHTKYPITLFQLWQKILERHSDE